jgi:hypothetical protein
MQNNPGALHKTRHGRCVQSGDDDPKERVIDVWQPILKPIVKSERTNTVRADGRPAGSSD